MFNDMTHDMARDMAFSLRRKVLSVHRMMDAGEPLDRITVQAKAISSMHQFAVELNGWTALPPIEGHQVPDMIAEMFRRIGQVEYQRAQLGRV